MPLSLAFAENGKSDAGRRPSAYLQAMLNHRGGLLSLLVMNHPTQFKPTKNHHKCLLSSPVRFVGEFEQSDFLLTHAFSGGAVDYGDRNFFIACFQSDFHEIEAAQIVLPDYSHVGEFLITCLSVYFGKRFDNHGLIETLGHFQMPNLETQVRVEGRFRDLPIYNKEPRSAFPVRLDLSQVDRITGLLSYQDSSAYKTFITAGQFYARSIQVFGVHPELAYVDLVTAGEVLSNYFEFTPDELYPQSSRDLFDEIESALPDGKRKRKEIESRYFQIKRRFKLTLLRSINTHFLENSEQITAQNIEQTIAAAYDLRSRYVHTGERFGNAVQIWSDFDKQIGKFVDIEPDFAKLLHRAPTFRGLERMIRYSLLWFAHHEICRLDDCFQNH